MKVTLKVDYKKALAASEDLVRRQLPFAAAMALNETARIAGQDLKTALPSVFDRPTPFTMRSIAMQGARKDNLAARIFVKDVQANYLLLQETGGIRTPAKKALVMPVDIALNQYGNIPRGALKRLKGRNKGAVFVGKVRGIGGFWQRGPHHSIRLLAAFKPEARYQPRLGFAVRINTSVARTFKPALARWLAKAIATSK